MDNIEKLKMVAKVNLIYSDYLFISDDDRPINKHLKSLGLMSLDKLKIKLKDKLEDNYKEAEGMIVTISYFSQFGGKPIFCVNEIDGEYDFDQIDSVY